MDHSLVISASHVKSSQGVAPPANQGSAGALRFHEEKRNGARFTLEDIDSLAVKVGTITGRVVNVPQAAEIVHLRGPDIAASAGGGGGVDDLLRGSLKPSDSGCSCDLDVCPGRRHQIVVPSCVHHEWITAAWVPDGVGPCRRRLPETEQSQQGDSDLN
jgi:hypothetical protein